MPIGTEDPNYKYAFICAAFTDSSQPRTHNLSKLSLSSRYAIAHLLTWFIMSHPFLLSRIFFYREFSYMLQTLFCRELSSIVNALVLLSQLSLWLLLPSALSSSSTFVPSLLHPPSLVLLLPYPPSFLLLLPYPPSFHGCFGHNSFSFLCSSFSTFVATC